MERMIMQAKGKEVLGIKVIAKRDGKETGKIKDILYNPDANSVRGFLISDGAVFGPGKMILFEDILSIGKDAVIILSSEQIRKEKDAPEDVAKIAKSDQYLVNTSIVTEDGTQLGKASDIVFDTETGKVVRLEVSPPALQRIQSGSKFVYMEDIVTVGEDVTIVKGYTEEEFKLQSQEQGVKGAIKKTSDNITEKVKDIGFRTNKKTQELKEKAGDKYREIKSDPENQQRVEEIKNKAGDAMERVEQAARDVRNRAQELTSDTKQKYDEVKNDPDVKRDLYEAKHKVKSGVKNVQDKIHSYPTQDENYQQPVGTLGGESSSGPDAPVKKAEHIIPKGTNVEEPGGVKYSTITDSKLKKAEE